MSSYTYATFLKQASLTHTQFILITLFIFLCIASILFCSYAGFFSKFHYVQTTLPSFQILYRDCLGNISEIRAQFQLIKHQINFAFKISKYFCVFKPLNAENIAAAIGVVISPLEQEKAQIILQKHPSYCKRSMPSTKVVKTTFKFYSQAIALIQFERLYNNLQNEVKKLSTSRNQITFVAMSEDRIMDKFDVQISIPLQNVKQFNLTTSMKKQNEQKQQ